MQHLDFCISETVGYFICVEIPSGVLILLLARGEKNGAGIGRRGESVLRSLKELRNWRPLKGSVAGEGHSPLRNLEESG